MPHNGDANDDNTPVPQHVIANPANRELVTVLANMFFESKQHTIGLHTLYEMARDWPGVVPPAWGHKLLDEEERHVTRITENLMSLRALFA